MRLRKLNLDEELKKIKASVDLLQLKTGNRKVVYTAITGGLDQLKEPEYVSDGVDYICLTDDSSVRSAQWKVVYIEFYYRDPRRLAKVFKLLPHKFLAAYEQSVWIDGNMTLVGPIEQILMQFVDNRFDIAFFQHPARNCLYSEAAACLRWGKDRRDIIDAQIKRYLKTGYPKNNGLIMGGVIFRSHNIDTVKKVMEMWWSEVDENSVRDQLSFNYCAHALKTDFMLIKNDEASIYLRREMHKKNAYYDVSITDKFLSYLSFFLTKLSLLRKGGFFN